ncbi:uncharacterized protein LOC113862278 [Abrus precatorius]|uniref:Uncharacterized protein LOC113862278 n=1 Tax=Abrus precatorius TaxID=3816 RepID=A0A8B8L8V6_ABRPR|nr:uncharacterized protein LOC113862278 [Abrus precatorius]
MDWRPFVRITPLQFKGGFDPNGAQLWIEELKKIFAVMECLEASKQIEAEGREINWESFKRRFLEKYFPEDLRRKKVEFLNLKQESITIGEYAGKFNELSKFCPYFNNTRDGCSRCTKFESGLRPNIKLAIGYQEIIHFPTLVNRCWIYENDAKAKQAQWKSSGPQWNHPNRRGDAQGRGKPYQVSQRCGKPSHFICDCPEMKRENNNQNNQAGGSKNKNNHQVRRPRTQGRVFAMNGEEASQSDTMIQGKCFINRNTFNVLYDSGASHFFISEVCVRQLNLHVTILPYDLIVSTLGSNSIITARVCLNCPIIVENKDLFINLFCLPLTDLKVILELDWLSVNRVLLDCHNKTIAFANPVKSSPENLRFLSANQVNASLKGGAHMCMMLLSLKREKEFMIENLSIVCDFLEVFPEIFLGYLQKGK